MKTRSVLLAACVALTLSACGTSGDSGSDTEASGAAEAGAFPVTVDHAYGSTTIDAEPMRIVTIGWSGQDAVIALNKVPVAMESFSGDGIENNILPWDASRLNGVKPVLMTTNPDIPFEQILGLDPDVILAVYSGIDEGEYKRLSDIAPTVAFPDQPWDTAWDKQMSMIGAALGQPEQAQTLIDETGAYFEKQAADHPQFQGKTATYAMRTDEGLIVFCGTDPRIRLLGQLGVKTSPGVDAVCTSGDSSVSVGMESIDTLDADVFILVDADGTNLDKLMSFGPFANMTSVSNGRLVRLVGMDYAMATSAPTVLSVPYAFDEFIAQLSDKLS
ncbi:MULTISPECIES: iron-siderophore ABC transporter substrate-binding protein [Rhodococcus]|jgi:iron complex transport system substrate-binding protein|uniref:iron-siderophore ABC transporter substrate-binding protein n=1 Tax=Rhodococcus TaxID=1827 RepID=UPI00038DCB00|nr:MULTISPECIES: iron-siderophore ABC transporter substrate-binding protein [Rhodococcus]AGT91334.1 ABC transporter substrate-binding protein [Rhodococcus erythropolis CCM2595]MCJ0899780.1 iron-siderophore ABC transporter substrate-binding protein [Rhodococcus sp. ARC_M13]MDF2470496.1 transporter substrate-binding protein [Rhodococcus erythropolis]MDV6207574.1 iron-siderophore ABC transporter substrate-binding protein [Rhodococcus erythropolis]OFV77995.1 putative siderophore-binding lipoprotei